MAGEKRRIIVEQDINGETITLVDVLEESEDSINIIVDGEEINTGE